MIPNLHSYIHLTILLIAIKATSSKTENKKTNHYWWEYLNYYEILGFEGDDSTANQKHQPPQLETSIITNFHPNRRIITKKNLNLYYQRSKITSQQIKQSYRKEARTYHPDKASSSKAKNKQDEYTARFNRIKEAYDTLSNYDSRSSYEQELYYEEKIVSQERTHVLNNMELWEDNNENENNNLRPINVYEKHENGYDPSTGMSIVRVYKREEFPRGMYRIWMQDFVHSESQIPLGAPQLIEEYMPQKNQFHSSQTKKSTNDNIPYQLHNGESTKILQSSNNLYRAKLTYDCELVIVRRKPLPHLKSKIVWSSRTYLTPKEEDEESPQCSFMFVNRQMIVYTSSSSGDEEDRSIVWHSKPPPPHSLDDTESSFLVLENDGILSIYFHSNSTSNPYHNTTTTAEAANNKDKLSFPFFGKFNSTRNIIPFVNTQQQMYCTKASQLWNTCYQKAIQKVPIIDKYSKKTVHAIQKVVHQTNPTVKKITNVWQESYHKTMLSIQNAVIKLTQTSIYHPKGDNSTNLLCIWSTNGCTPFPILRLVRFAFLAIQYQLVSNVQGIIHAVSNRRKQQDYEEYYEEDDDIDSTNPIEWISEVGRQMYRWGKNTFYDLFGNEDDDYEDEEEDYMLNVFLRNKMNRWKDTMNHRMDMPF